MTDIPLPLSNTRPLTGTLRTAISRSLSAVAETARLCGRSFSGIPSAIMEAQTMVYSDPYGLRDKRREEQERY
jgi:hypothetical protein